MIASTHTDQRSSTIANRDASAMTRIRAALILSTVFTLCVVAAATLWTSSQAHAQAQGDIYSVSDVAVDFRAGSTTEARARGLESGQVEALNRLFQRIVPQQNLTGLPDLSTRDVIEHVRDFSIANERTSPGRYLADLTVRFQPDAVRTTLRFANVPFAETVSKPVVVVPIYQPSIVDDPVLWADPNPWRDAWDTLPMPTGLVPRELPFVDLEDLTMLRIQDVLVRDVPRIQAWADRYGAENAVLATAALVGGLGSEAVRVTLYFTRTGTERAIDVPATGAQTWAELFSKGAEAAWALIEDQWKTDNMLRFDITGQMTALVPVTTLQDWLTVRTRLQQVPTIDRFEMQAMTKDRVQVTLYYIGDADQLALAMAQSDLGFVSQEGVWVIEDRTSDRVAGQMFGQPADTTSVATPVGMQPSQNSLQGLSRPSLGAGLAPAQPQ